MPCPVCTFWKLPGLAHGPLISGTFPNLVVEALGNLSLPLGGGHLFQEGKSYEIPSEKRKRELWPLFQGSKPIWELGDPQVSIHYSLLHTSQMQVSRNSRLRFQTPSPNATYCFPPTGRLPGHFWTRSSPAQRNLCFVANEGWQITTSYKFEHRQVGNDLPGKGQSETSGFSSFFPTSCDGGIILLPTL